MLSRLFLFLLLISCFACQPKDTKSEQQADERPNIIIILADDMGYSDIGSYGGEIETPNLDRLAANGLRYRSFYNDAKCCPTRASLLTGLYHHEAGMGAMISPINKPIEEGPYQGFLNKESVTIAEVLKQAGYATYMSGKWHVGERKQHWPRKRGFDRYFGLISGASSYYELIKDQPRIRQMGYDDENWEPPADNFYMTDAFADSAAVFVNTHFQKEKENPFFLYLAFNAPHWPLHAPKETIKKYENKYLKGWDQLRAERYKRQLEIGIIDENFPLSERTEKIPAWDDAENKEDWAHRMAVYAAMVDKMDQGIGKVIASLEKNNQLENTLIFFLADNGGCAENIEGRKLHNPNTPIGEKGSYVAYREPWANASNTPYRYYKNWMHEGGIKTPLIAFWPKGIKEKGKIITDQIGHITDLMPTCVEVAKTAYPTTFNDIPIKKMRGKSLVPVFTNKIVDHEKPLFYEFGNARAVRWGDWKLVAARWSKDWQLYNLKDDPIEKNNLASNMPEKVKELQDLYEQWADEVGVKKRK